MTRPIDVTESAYPLTCHTFAPQNPSDRPPLVVVHGASRRPIEHFRSFLPAAVQADVPLIVPDFIRPQYVGFQRLAGRAGKLAAAHAFQAAVAQACDGMGSSTARIDLVGFSGGAQFAHRYAMLFPDRVRRLVVAAAGWYTIPDSSRRFPHGAVASPHSGGIPVRVEEFLRLPIRVMVGERDTQRDSLLRVSKRLDAEQGPHRFARALRWTERLRVEASVRDIRADIGFELLPDTGHSLVEAVERGGFADRVIAFMSAEDLPLAASPAVANLAGHDFVH